MTRTSIVARIVVASLLPMAAACTEVTESVGHDESSAKRAKPACSDHEDNDGDGRADYPHDPGCTSRSDDDETDPAPPAPPPSCTPTTCAAEGASCGTISDGCGGTLACGTCASPETCGGGGVANVCGGGGSSASPFRLLLSDDFNGSDLDSSKWDKYGQTSDWPGNGGNGLRVARAVSVANGIATITATPAANTSTGKLESGAFTAADSYRLTYGRYETRLRVDDDPSRVMSAVTLLWNVDTTANPWCSGESDFYETGTDHTSWMSFLHYEIGTPNCSDTTTQWYSRHASDPRQWHDVALEWTPNRYEVFVDGISEGVTTNPDFIPDWKQRLTFQLDAMNSGTLAQPVRMQVDYARIYEYVP